MKDAKATAKAQVTHTEHPGGAQGAVLAALASRPGTTAAEIAAAAGICHSTAAKALAALAGQGRVERDPGGRDGARRLPDRWSLASQKKRQAKPVAHADGVDGEVTAADRLGRGGLVSMVLAHLRASPGEHSPTSVAKAIGARSAGATANALVRLVERGEAVQTAEKPKRYQAAARS